MMSVGAVGLAYGNKKGNKEGQATTKKDVSKLLLGGWNTHYIVLESILYLCTCAHV